MYAFAGRWEGAFINDDGSTATPFSLIQPSEHDSSSTMASLHLSGGAARPITMLDGARSALVALADAVPNPVGGCLEQVLVEARVLGDRLVGRWLRRNANGVLVSEGRLTAVRSVA